VHVHMCVCACACVHVCACVSKNKVVERSIEQLGTLWVSELISD